MNRRPRPTFRTAGIALFASRCFVSAPAATLAFFLLASLSFSLSPSTASPQSPSANPFLCARQDLTTGWQMETSAKSPGDGATISRPGYNAQSWYHLSKPETVLAALVENHVYPDPTIGKNLRQIPGATYKIGTMFANQ